MEIVKRKSLGECTVDLEILCRLADDKDGILSDNELAAIDSARVAHADRVDNWIAYLDAIKSLTATIEERKARADRALKTAKSLHERLKAYLKFLVESHPSLPWKGADGSIHIQKNPKRLALAHEDDIKSVSVPYVVPADVIEAEPSMRPYLKEVRYMILDRELVRDDLESGMKLPWAHFEQGSHLRTR